MFKRLSMVVGILMLVFGLTATAGADLVNGNFESGLTGWTSFGNVGVVSVLDYPSAVSWGMQDHYASLGATVTAGDSTLRQNFAVSGAQQIAVSFNWFFKYNQPLLGTDTFAAIVSEQTGLNFAITIGKLMQDSLYTGGSDSVIYGTYTGLLSLPFSPQPGTISFDLSEPSWSTTESMAGVDNVSVTPVPEPGTLLLLGSGLLGLGGFAWRRRKS